MAIPIPRRTALLVLALACCAYALNVVGEEKLQVKGAGSFTSVLSTDLQTCTPIKTLSALKDELEEGQSPVMRQVFAWLFPFGPAWNSGVSLLLFSLSSLPALFLSLHVLGTFYISSVPNFILAFIPAEINPNTLNTMTAFATGGLLSDVFLHLVPHAFMGEHSEGGVHFVMVEEKRNILIGLGIFIGFASFFIMEKTLRVLGNDSSSSSSSSSSHTHSHSHSPSTSSSPSSATPSATPSSPAGKASGVSTASSDGLKSRKEKADGEKAVEEEKEESEKAKGGPSKLSAYLNLFGDFVHNIMAASFYSSPLIGATTTLACFAHEIPHEIADYSILVRSGFSKGEAMRSQYVTAVGAFIGTFIGIAIHNISASEDPSAGATNLADAVRQQAGGILGTSVQLSDLVIPFVAGGFMYIGAVAVLPTLLEESKSGKQALREFAAMAFGVLCMFLVAWNE
ncbi:ZIP zinc transporter-domain-containing protein [Irpex lacteus]|nr:ZIP zinc transporter-domain-containing protein [Irpex lacteus]